MTDRFRAQADYFRLMNANGAAHVYREALRAGVLDAFRAGPASAAEVAGATGLEARPVTLLLAVLAALGLVEEADQGRAQRLTPLGRLLVEGGYRDLGDRYWAHLPAFLRSAVPGARMDAPDEREAQYRGQAAALGWMLAPAAEALATALDAAGSLAGAALLDVGAGSGVWSLTLARRAPGATVTALDWPAVLPVAEDTARRLGLRDRLSLLPGDYHRIDLPRAAFDLALLGNVTHLEPPDANRSLLIRVRAALRPAGRVAILDVLPGLAEGDLNRALYALGLALRTEGGHVYSPDELEALLGEAGFGPARRVSLDAPPFAVGLLIAGRD